MVVFDVHYVHISLSSLFMLPLPVQSYQCTQMRPLYRSHDNCGSLVVYMDSSMSASRFASHLLELVVLWVWLPSMSAYHSKSTEYTVLKSRQNHYGQTKGVVLISILFMLNSPTTAFDNLTVSIALPVTARERVSRNRKQWLKHALYLWQVSWVFYLWLFSITICTDTNTSVQDAEIALG